MPRSILIAGACGIGIFIMFVGWKGMVSGQPDAPRGWSCPTASLLGLDTPPKVHLPDVWGQRTPPAVPATVLPLAGDPVLQALSCAAAAAAALPQGVVVADKYPNLVRLNTETQYAPTGWGSGAEQTGIGFNRQAGLVLRRSGDGLVGDACPWQALAQSCCAACGAHLAAVTRRAASVDRCLLLQTAAQCQFLNSVACNPAWTAAV